MCNVLFVNTRFYLLDKCQFEDKYFQGSVISISKNKSSYGNYTMIIQVCYTHIRHAATEIIDV